MIRLKTAKDIMVKSGDVLSFSPENGIRDVIAKLAQSGFSGGPVVKDGKVVGIISESDIVTLADKSGKDDVGDFVNSLAIGRMKVSDIMSKKVVTVGPDADVREIATKMADKKVNRVIVADSSGALLGLIARDDIVEAAVHEL